MAKHRLSCSSARLLQPVDQLLLIVIIDDYHFDDGHEYDDHDHEYDDHDHTVIIIRDHQAGAHDHEY